jgi:hypothetical protein
MHPMWWLVLPYVGAIAALEAVTYLRTGVGGSWVERRSVVRLGFVLLVVLVLVWGARGLGAFGGPAPID